MKTHDSAATRMNKINAPMRTALSEIQGMAVPFQDHAHPGAFRQQDMTLRRIGVCARSHPEKATEFPAQHPPRLKRQAGRDAEKTRCLRRATEIAG
jgi:hypothetical protein